MIAAGVALLVAGAVVAAWAAGHRHGRRHPHMRALDALRRVHTRHRGGV